MLGNLLFIFMASLVSIFTGFLIGKNNQKKKQDKMIQDLRCSNLILENKYEMLKTTLNPVIHIGAMRTQHQIEDIKVCMREGSYFFVDGKAVKRPCTDNLSSSEKLHIIANEIAKQIEQRPYLLKINQEQMYTQYTLSVIKYDEF